MLDKTLIMYGSPMGDSNLHNHRRCPLILLGGANGKLPGNVHLKAPDGTPMANAMLDVMHKLGIDDIDQFGDATGTFCAGITTMPITRAFATISLVCAAALASTVSPIASGRRRSARRRQRPPPLRMRPWPAMRPPSHAAEERRRRQRAAGRRHDGAALGARNGATRRRRRCCSTPAPTRAR